MPLHRDPQRIFEQRIRAVTTAGVSLPDDLLELQHRLQQFHRNGTPMRDRIAAAIIDNDPAADLSLWWAAALAEGAQNPALNKEVFDGIRLKVNAEIRERYSRHAARIYTELAASFDSAGRKFSAAVNTVDPELDAAVVIDSPARDQKAWREAAVQKAELDRLLPALIAAAQLAGIIDSDEDTDVLPLCADTAGLHRRRVWEAWQTDDREALAERRERSQNPFTRVPLPRSRTGRWGALAALGAVIRAHDPAIEFIPYRRPKRLVERMVNAPGGPRRITLDPEDPDYSEPEPVTVDKPPRIRVTT